MRLIASLALKVSLGLASNLFLPNFAFAEALLPPEELARAQCQRRLVETPTSWIDESAPLSTSLTAAGPVCPQGVVWERGSTRSTWNRRSATIRKGTCNGAFPILEVNVPGEANNIYIIDTRLNLFSWNQAYTLGCHGFARDEADKANWRLPTRTQRAHFQFMMAVPGFLRPSAVFQRDNNRQEQVYATFVEEESPQESISCYANTFTGFIFSDSFFYNSAFGLSNRDFASRANTAQGSGDLVSAAREQTIQVLIRYSLGGQMLADESANRNLQEHISRIITVAQKNEISRLYRSAGVNGVQRGLELVRVYVTRNIDWTRVFSDTRFSNEMRNRQANIGTYNQLQALNRPRAEGGGLPVYCITEARKSGR